MKAIVLTKYRSPGFFERKEIEKTKPKSGPVFANGKRAGGSLMCTRN